MSRLAAVSAGGSQRASGTEQIARAMTQMERVTQQTAANAEQGAWAAEKLTAHPAALKEIIGCRDDETSG